MKHFALIAWQSTLFFDCITWLLFFDCMMALFSLIAWDGSLFFDCMRWLSFLWLHEMALFSLIIWDGSLFFDCMRWLSFLWVHDIGIFDLIVCHGYTLFDCIMGKHCIKEAFFSDCMKGLLFFFDVTPLPVLQIHKGTIFISSNILLVQPYFDTYSQIHLHVHFHQKDISCKHQLQVI